MSKSMVILGSCRFTILQVMTKCGKPSCRCNKGLLHGPYWHARFLTEGGKRETVYLGKQLEGKLRDLRDLALKG